MTYPPTTLWETTVIIKKQLDTQLMWRIYPGIIQTTRQSGDWLIMGNILPRLIQYMDKSFFQLHGQHGVMRPFGLDFISWMNTLRRRDAKRIKYGIITR